MVEYQAVLTVCCPPYLALIPPPPCRHLSALHLPRPPSPFASPFPSPLSPSVSCSSHLISPPLLFQHPYSSSVLSSLLCSLPLPLLLLCLSRFFRCLLFQPVCSVCFAFLEIIFICLLDMILCFSTCFLPAALFCVPSHV